MMCEEVTRLTVINYDQVVARSTIVSAFTSFVKVHFVFDHQNYNFYGLMMYMLRTVIHAMMWFSLVMDNLP